MPFKKELKGFIPDMSCLCDGRMDLHARLGDGF